MAERPRGRRPKADLVYLEDCEIQPRQADEEGTSPEPLTRVTVLAPFSVSHDGTAYYPEAVTEVPASLASWWISNRWVTKDL
jgi:hypothetical protein